jgi:glutamine synthetase
VPGYEAPINLVYSQRNRSASIRIPLYSKSAKTKRIEYRCPDASCNPYLAFAAMLMAGLDGIRNKIDPGEPIDRDILRYEPEGKAMSSPPPAPCWRYWTPWRKTMSSAGRRCLPGLITPGQLQEEE